MNSPRNADQIRRRNLSTVLALVSEAGQISRADVTAATKLDRSTIARIVGRLEQLRLVTETEPASTNRVGRPSPMVRAHTSPAVIAVNPEVDAITVGIVGLSATMIHSSRIEMDHIPTPEETALVIAETIDGWPEDVLRERRLLGVGLAVPGLVRSERVVRWAPHLGWADAPLASLIESAVGLPAWVGNDASLGALAEWRYGAGRGTDDLIYLNGGASGIGGGIIADGRSLGGGHGYAGEFGQARVDVAGNRRLEEEVGRAQVLEVLGLRSADESSLETLVLTSDVVAVADELARQRAVLSVALGNAANILNPSMIVLGGFLGTLLASGPDELGMLVASHCEPSAWEGVTIVRAALGVDVLMIGAGELAFRSVMADSGTIWDEVRG